MQNPPDKKVNAFPWLAFVIGLNSLLVILTMVLAPGDISDSVRESYTKGEMPSWAKKISLKVTTLSSSVVNLQTHLESISQTTNQLEKIRTQVDAEMTPILQLVVGQIENLGKRIEELDKRSKEMENSFFSHQKK